MNPFKLPQEHTVGVHSVKVDLPALYSVGPHHSLLLRSSFKHSHRKKKQNKSSGESLNKNISRENSIDCHDKHEGEKFKIKHTVKASIW